MTLDNPQLDRAWRIIENTNMHLFLTGKAGTGKTTFLKNLKKSSPKRMIVTAPTGIAAINAEGMTIHSFFQLPFAPYVPDTTFQSKDSSKYRFGKEKIKLIRSIDLLVIDEISMVRADLLDAVDAVLRRYRHSHLPFGGVQLLMIGDLQQLAPVVKQEEWEMLSKYYETPFFFSSRALSETFYATIELEQIYRQTDATFLDILNKIRQNKADRATLELLNKRFIPNFVPPSNESYIQLTTHNILAQNINERKLAEIDFDAFTYTAEIKGKFPEYSYPTDESLTLKQGAQVMFIKNDRSMEKRYFNGMIGEIVAIDEDGFVVRSKDYPEDIRVEREIWENSRYVLNEQTQEIREEVEGTFVQFPVRLAWAITIHKSQGLTFSHAIIDAKDSFAHGQVYVALSRCRTLEGMVLSTQLGAEAIITDHMVNSFTSAIAQRTPNEQHLEHWEKNFFHQLLQELFNFSPIEKYIEDAIKVINEHFIDLYPKTKQQLLEHGRMLKSKLIDVAVRFSNQYTPIISSQDDYASSAHLQERIKQGAKYFAQEFSPIAELAMTLSFATDNQQVKKKADECTEKLKIACEVKLRLLEHTHENGFQVNDHLKQRAVLTLKTEGELTPITSSQKKKKQADKIEVPSEIGNPDLYQAIVKWRQRKATESSLPPYCIVQQKALLGLTNLMPDTKESMSLIPCMGKITIEKYGDDLLEIIKKYLQDNNLTTKLPCKK